MVSLSLVAACGLPSSGKVEQGLAVQDRPPPPIKLQFEAPRAGASQEEIVRGFLAAQWSADDDYRAARAYLTKAVSEKWAPDSVVVHPTGMRPQTVKSKDGSSVTVTVVEIGVLDSDGRFHASTAGTTREVEISLAKVDGEWRISSLPKGFGLWLSEFYFDSTYRPFQVSYGSTMGSTLVPDWRRFAVGPGLTTSLARALLGPVPSHLAGAVRSGFPSGTTLAVDAVPVGNGVATMDLTGRALAMNSSERHTAWAQTLRTMRQAGTVDRVAMTAEGRPLEVMGLGSLPERVGDVGYSGAPARSPVVVRRVGDVLTPLSSASFPAEVGKAALPALPKVPEEWSRAAISLDLRDVMAANESGTALARWVDGQRASVQSPGSGMSAPAYDVMGHVWLGGQDAKSEGAVWVFHRVGDAGAVSEPRPVRVSAPWLHDRRVIDVRPSPEGHRVVVLSKDAAGAMHVDVSGVVSSSGVPSALPEPLAVAQDVVDATSVMWVNDSTLAFVGSRNAGQPLVPLVAPLAGVTQEYSGVAGVSRLISMGGERGLVGVDQANQVLRKVGSRWQRIGTASDLLVPAR
ncbi:GerMN domain-containing protein [Dermatophilus congolensis]|uniref:GerMN domain-containing protein n=7 Tax=Dermatophilus congolensis TaxID=1863 RepID=UPI001AAE4D29|nr:hypothetical protein [Dermatophilus congolensis]MBO3145708.1 hypothetical protein [Dermatophilus congolensis]MBO3154706.1 hypothetical protein [Dermatophilus congolensis]MBO3158233.1 hypothetical protein [Dermatophilus congolensis]MBO3189810.1 hypothetical protein [Dermatophilus congolensis]